MFDIFDKNVIRIARGNSASINITPIDTDTGTPVILSDGDKVLFTSDWDSWYQFTGTQV